MVAKFSFFSRFDKVSDLFESNLLLNDLIAHRLKKNHESSAKAKKGSHVVTSDQ
jgi:hypothetical protein